MSKKYKDIENFIIDNIRDISKSEKNVKLYKDMFDNMSDIEFENFINDLRNKNATLSIFVPLGEEDDTKISVENNFKVAEKLGHNFYSRIIYYEDKDEPYMTEVKRIVLRLPVKRPSQSLVSKIGVPDDAETIDITTGQVTGSSKGSKITLPELQILDALGCNDSLVELMKIRGGDKGALRAHDAMIQTFGHSDQDIVLKYSTGVVSTKTLKSIFKAMHLKINL